MVCRYDQGHAFAFQCSFHGWVYNSSGQLVVLPPGSEQDYSDLNKAEWGLLEARVEIFYGSIWANWDKTAPDFIEYLGGMETYLKNVFLDEEGTESSIEEGGVDVLGGVMKWEFGMNWKVPMPDHDSTHAWVTHRSYSVVKPGFGGVNSVTVDRAGQSNYALTRRPEDGRPRRGGARPGQTMNISFPHGHTTSLFWPDDLDAPVPESAGFVGTTETPALAEYMRGKRAEKLTNVGKRLVNIGEGPHIFPNTGFSNRGLRVLHPNGPASTEQWTYFLVDKDMPAEAREELARNFEITFGPAGTQQKDDLENWYILTQYSKGTMTRRTPLNMYLRLGEPPLHGPTTESIQMPGYWQPDYSDENNRAFYHRWAEVLTANDWTDLQLQPVR